MRIRVLLAMTIAIIGTLTVAYAADAFQVRPANFDPAHTFLVQSTWLTGIGCPTNPRISLDGTTTVAGVSDPACTTGDSRDKRNDGLLLVKTGPTNNYAAATAKLTSTPSHVTELGYDIRKSTAAVSPNGSHCGAGAPRFDIVAQDGTDYFLGCNSPAAVSTTASQSWLRLRWAAPLMAFNANTGVLTDVTTLTVKSITIVFDEGTDTGPDFFGAAILDNIDVNGTLVGQGPNNGDNGDNGDNGNNGDGGNK
jgi:hypothetical protein